MNCQLCFSISEQRSKLTERNSFGLEKMFAICSVGRFVPFATSSKEHTEQFTAREYCPNMVRSSKRIASVMSKRTQGTYTTPKAQHILCTDLYRRGCLCPLNKSNCCLPIRLLLRSGLTKNYKHAISPCNAHTQLRTQVLKENDLHRRRYV